MKQFFSNSVIWLVLWSVGSAAQAQGLLAENARQIDFSGTWEMDFSKSDDVNRELQTLVREIRRRQQRQQQANDGRGGPTLSVGGGQDSVPSLLGLARMADLVTRSQLLEIEQGRTRIEVDREDTFALACDFHGGMAAAVENPLGRELCGWDLHQLVFRLYLPEGLTIQHRMTLGPEGKRLNIATTVISDRVSQPFTIDRVYNRFQPGRSRIRCETTITRGKICSTVSS